MLRVLQKQRALLREIEHMAGMVCKYEYIAIDWPRDCALAACSYLGRKSTYEYGSLYNIVYYF